jgi:murein DD-endopeptidase MepM/ murein hydrolase activator NlpD
MEGDPLQAILPGRIAAAVHDRPPYGNMLMIEVPFENLPPAVVESIPIPEGQSLYVLYAHLKDAPTQAPGEPVECGTELNRAGTTGAAVAPHLHFETLWGPPGTTFAGMAYYIADATPLELQNYATWHMSGEFHPFNPMLLLNLLQP